MLSALLLPILGERFPNRGLVEGNPPDPCAFFPGIHPGIRGISIYDDGDELTLCVDDLTHGHFSDYTDESSGPVRERRIVDIAVEFLDAMFADQVVVWGQKHMGGWYRPQLGGTGRNTVIELGGTGSLDVVQEFVWSGPLPQRHTEPGDASGGGA